MSQDFVSLQAKTADDAPPGDRLEHYAQEFLEQRESLYLDLAALKQVDLKHKEVTRTTSDINLQIDTLNPRGIPPHFMTVIASERPSILPEVRDDVLPTFAAADRQGILWSRGILSINGIKESQTGHDGSADNIVSTDIAGLDVIAFNYAFDGTDWDRIRMVSDASDDLATTTTGNVGTMAKLLGFDGSTYDRIRTAQFNANALATGTSGGLVTNSILRVFNGTTFNFAIAEANNADGAGTNATADKLITMSNERGFNGTSWDRLRCAQWNADTLAPASVGGLVVNSVGRLFDGTNFNLMRGSSNNGDGVATSATNNLVNTVALLRGFNGSTIDRIRSGSSAADGIATNATGNLHVLAHPELFNGTTFDRARSASAASQSAASMTGAAQIAPVGNWSVVDFPATGVAATVTRAAGGAGVRHICTGITATISGAAAAATGLIRVDILDGAAVMFSAVLSAVANTTSILHLTGLALVGTANTAMTFQFGAGGGAGTQESITGYGYDVA